MDKVKISVHVPKSEAIRRGLDTCGDAEIIVDLQALTQEQRDVLACTHQTLTVTEPTTEAVAHVLNRRIAEIAERREQARKAAEEEKAKAAAYVDSYCALPVEQRIEPSCINYFRHVAGAGVPMAVYEHAMNDERFRAARAEAEELLVAIVAEARAEKARQEAAEKAAAEAEAEAKRRQIAEWVNKHGTANQKGRLALGLLPDEEVLSEMWTAAFSNLSQFTRYSKLTAEDIVGCQCGDGQDAVFSVGQATSVGPETFDVYQGILEQVPDANLVIREHKAKCLGCGAVTTRNSILVSVKCGAATFSRAYAG